MDIRSVKGKGRHSNSPVVSAKNRGGISDATDSDTTMTTFPLQCIQWCDTDLTQLDMLGDLHQAMSDRLREGHLYNIENVMLTATYQLIINNLLCHSYIVDCAKNTIYWIRVASRYSFDCMSWIPYPGVLANEQGRSNLLPIPLTLDKF